MAHPAPSAGVLTLRLPDLAALHKAYMPFIKHGGLFVPTSNRYKLGQEVFVMVFLPEEQERRPVPGRVAWINAGSSTSRPPGIGIQFMEGAKFEEIKSRIEVLLAAYPHRDLPTHTM